MIILDLYGCILIQRQIELPGFITDCLKHAFLIALDDLISKISYGLRIFLMIQISCKAFILALTTYTWIFS